MEFRLIYEGQLNTKASARDKHNIRKFLHPQVKRLWDFPPLDLYKKNLTGKERLTFIKQIGRQEFVFIASKENGLSAEIHVLLMRPESPGNIIVSGDLDNRLKPLFDGLRCPKTADELPQADELGEFPFFCVLEDDEIITSVNVTVDRLLQPKNERDLLVILHVKLRMSKPTWLATFAGS